MEHYHFSGGYNLRKPSTEIQVLMKQVINIAQAILRTGNLKKVAYFDRIYTAVLG